MAVYLNVQKISVASQSNSPDSYAADVAQACLKAARLRLACQLVVFSSLPRLSACYIGRQSSGQSQKSAASGRPQL
eukprot:359469-Chlamydomonas_euryale.AAC.14